MINIVAEARVAAYFNKTTENDVTFLDYDKFTDNQITFMASTQTEVSKGFYQFTKTRKFPQWHTNIQLGYVGSSSINTVTRIMDTTNGSELARNVNQIVFVDKSGKPGGLAGWWKDKYGGLAIGNKPCIVAPVTIPENRYKYTMKVPWGEIDTYKHTNYLSYIRFCFDAAMEAMQAGAYTRFKPGGDILEYNVKKVQTSYTGESKAGDVLSIDTAQGKDNPLKLYFDFTKDGKTINQNTIEFHEP